MNLYKVLFFQIGDLCIVVAKQILEVVISKIKTHGLNGSLVHAVAECAERHIVPILGLEKAIGLERGGFIAGTGVFTSRHSVRGIEVAAVACLNLKLRNIDDLSVSALENIDICRKNRKHRCIGRCKVVQPRFADNRLTALFAVKPHPAGECHTIRSMARIFASMSANLNETP